MKAEGWGTPAGGYRVEAGVPELHPRSHPSRHARVPAAPWGTFVESHYEPILHLDKMKLAEKSSHRSKAPASVQMVEPPCANSTYFTSPHT